MLRPEYASLSSKPYESNIRKPQEDRHIDNKYTDPAVSHGSGHSSGHAGTKGSPGFSLNTFLLLLVIVGLMFLLIKFSGKDSGQPNTTQSPLEKMGRTFSTQTADVEMIWVNPGSFMMGAPGSETDRGYDERPHRVELTEGYWLGKYEVTQSQWELVMGNNPSEFSGRRRPVEQVSWEACVRFCRRLTKREREVGRLPAGYEYGLPTEAQWEYACRAGTTTATAFGNSLSSRQANFDGDYPYGEASKGPYLKRTSDVGSYHPNGWGFYDMHGNVLEWCHDWYGSYGGAVRDPTGPSSGSGRVFRGGGWGDYGKTCRSASRSNFKPSDWDVDLGFRVSLRSKLPSEWLGL